MDEISIAASENNMVGRYRSREELLQAKRERDEKKRKEEYERIWGWKADGKKMYKSLQKTFRSVESYIGPHQHKKACMHYLLKRVQELKKLKNVYGRPYAAFLLRHIMSYQHPGVDSKTKLIKIKLRMLLELRGSFVDEFKALKPIERSLVKDVRVDSTKVLQLRLKRAALADALGKLKIITDTIENLEQMKLCKSINHEKVSGCPICGAIVGRTGGINVISIHRVSKVESIKQWEVEMYDLERERDVAEGIKAEKVDILEEFEAELRYIVSCAIQNWWCMYLARKSYTKNKERRDRSMFYFRIRQLADLKRRIDQDLSNNTLNVDKLKEEFPDYKFEINEYVGKIAHGKMQKVLAVGEIFVRKLKNAVLKARKRKFLKAQAIEREKLRQERAAAKARTERALIDMRKRLKYINERTLYCTRPECECRMFYSLARYETHMKLHRMRDIEHAKEVEAALKRGGKKEDAETILMKKIKSVRDVIETGVHREEEQQELEKIQDAAAAQTSSEENSYIDNAARLITGIGAKWKPKDKDKDVVFIVSEISPTMGNAVPGSEFFKEDSPSRSQSRVITPSRSGSPGGLSSTNRSPSNNDNTHTPILKRAQTAVLADVNSTLGGDADGVDGISMRSAMLGLKRSSSAGMVEGRVLEVDQNKNQGLSPSQSHIDEDMNDANEGLGQASFADSSIGMNTQMSMTFSVDSRSHKGPPRSVSEVDSSLAPIRSIQPRWGILLKGKHKMETGSMWTKSTATIETHSQVLSTGVDLEADSIADTSTKVSSIADSALEPIPVEKMRSMTLEQKIEAERENIRRKEKRENIFIFDDPPEKKPAPLIDPRPLSWSIEQPQLNLAASHMHSSLHHLELLSKQADVDVPARVPLNKAVIRTGSLTGCGIELELKTFGLCRKYCMVSKIHCLIYVPMANMNHMHDKTTPPLTVVDNNSLFGTYVVNMHGAFKAPTKITEGVALHSGDLLCIGVQPRGPQELSPEIAGQACVVYRVRCANQQEGGDREK